MWARDSPRECDECSDNKGCHTLVPKLDEKNSVQVLCDGCKTRPGEFWVDVLPGGGLELGEANCDFTYRPKGTILASLRALQALF
jgi:hypothetical protein